MTKPFPEIPDQLAYTIIQAARVIGRSPSRIKKAIKANELAARRDGRVNMIERSELARWVSSRPVANRGAKDG